LTAAPLRRLIPERRVRREVRWAAVELALAVRRARAIGAANAATDRRVQRRVRRATAHATRAVEYTVSPPPRHRLRNAIFFVLGVISAAAAVTWVRNRRSSMIDDDGGRVP
jgi:hypothetical protein